MSCSTGWGSDTAPNTYFDTNIVPGTGPYQVQEAVPNSFERLVRRDGVVIVFSFARALVVVDEVHRLRVDSAYFAAAQPPDRVVIVARHVHQRTAA